MADLTRVVSILFEADDKMSASISSVVSSFDKFDSKINALAEPLASFGDKIAKIDAALAAMAIGGAAYAIGKYAEFEDKMLTVKGVMQASDEEYERLTALTKGLGETTRFTAEQAADGLLYLAMAGMKTNDAMGALPEVLKLAQAANVDLGQAADIVTNIMAGYGKQVSELAGVNDVLVATLTNSNTNLVQLYDAFKMVGPLAKAMGVDITDLAGVLGVLGNAGYQGEMGGTALRNILVALAEPTKEMSKLLTKLGVDTTAMGVDLGSGQKALESLGVKVKDANGNMRPLVDIIADLQVGIQKIHDPVDQAGILMEVFGKRGGPQMAALLTQGADSIRDLEEKIRSAGGVTSDIAAQMESGMGGALRALTSAVEAAVLNIGEELKAGAVPATAGATELFRAIAAAVDTGAFDDVLDVISGWGESLGDLFETIAQNLPEALERVDFSRFLEALDDFGASVSDVFGKEVDLTSVEGLAKAIQDVVDFLTGLVRVTDGMAQAMGPIFTTIIDGIRSLANADKEQSEVLGNLIGASKLVVELGTGVVAALALIERSGADVQRVYDVVAGSIKTAWNTLQTGFDSIVLLIVDSIEAILDSVNQLTFGTMSEQIGSAKQSLADFRQAVVQDFTAQIGDIQDGFEQIGRGFGLIGDSAQEASTKTDQLTESIDGIPESREAKVDVVLTGDKEVDAWLNHMGDVESIAVSAFLKADETKSEAEVNKLKDSAEKKEITVRTAPKVDDQAVASANKKLKEGIPEQKLIEIQLKGEIDTRIAEIKANAETVQKAVEWQAKLDIAKVEAETERLKSMLENTSDVISATAESISDLFGAIPKDSVNWMAWYDALKQQKDIQLETHKLNKQILEQQIEMMKAKRERLKKGDALIKIDASSLATPLKELLKELVNLIHIEADMMGEEYLLGV